MKRPSYPLLAYALPVLISLASIAVMTGCSQKPSDEERAAQTKVITEKAVEEAKKQILADQAAEKEKKDAAVAAQAAEKAKQEEAVATAKKELIAEQRATARAHTNKPSSSATSTGKSVCANCGVVVSINQVETEGKGSGLGVVAGGVVGGLLGNQVGNGTGRDLATIAGVVGGALAGNKIEKNAKKTTGYDITVKMDSGEDRVVHQATAPNVVKGDKIKIENDEIVKR